MLAVHVLLLLSLGKFYSWYVHSDTLVPTLAAQCSSEFSSNRGSLAANRNQVSSLSKLLSPAADPSLKQCWTRNDSAPLDLNCHSLQTQVRLLDSCSNYCMIMLVGETILPTPDKDTGIMISGSLYGGTLDRFFSNNSGYCGGAIMAVNISLQHHWFGLLPIPDSVGLSASADDQDSFDLAFGVGLGLLIFLLLCIVISLNRFGKIPRCEASSELPVPKTSLPSRSSSPQPQHPHCLTHTPSPDLDTAPEIEQPSEPHPPKQEYLPLPDPEDQADH